MSSTELWIKKENMPAFRGVLGIEAPLVDRAYRSPLVERFTFNSAFLEKLQREFFAARAKEFRISNEVKALERQTRANEVAIRRFRIREKKIGQKGDSDPRFLDLRRCRERLEAELIEKAEKDERKWMRGVAKTVELKRRALSLPRERVLKAIEKNSKAFETRLIKKDAQFQHIIGVRSDSDSEL